MTHWNFKQRKSELARDGHFTDGQVFQKATDLVEGKRWHPS